MYNIIALRVSLFYLQGGGGGAGVFVADKLCISTRVGGARKIECWPPNKPMSHFIDSNISHKQISVIYISQVNLTLRSTVGRSNLQILTVNFWLPSFSIILVGLQWAGDDFRYAVSTSNLSRVPTCNFQVPNYRANNSNFLLLSPDYRVPSSVKFRFPTFEFPFPSFIFQFMISNLWASTDKFRVSCRIMWAKFEVGSFISGVFIESRSSKAGGRHSAVESHHRAFVNALILSDIVFFVCFLTESRIPRFTRSVTATVISLMNTCKFYIYYLTFNPLTAGATYIRVSFFIRTLCSTFWTC